ncbi:MAG: PEP-CTERM sorting domain-containing protein [Chthoniobacterales bacterium]
MKSQLNLTAAKLRRFLLVTALAVTPFLAFQAINAQPFTAVATLTNSVGGGNSINIAAGGTFTLSLAVTTNFISSGYTVFYQSLNGAGNFMLVSRVNTSPISAGTGTNVFNDPTTSDALAFGGMAGKFMFGPTMNSNQFDLGYTGDQTNNQALGTFNLQNITIMVLANAAPGSYQIRLDPRSIMTERAGFNDVNMGGANGPFFTVNVIPEPSTVALAVLGGAGLLVLVLRRQRATA